MQHKFKWGIGNTFRSQNANRFVPVHHARPKEVTIPIDYFSTPDKRSIRYDPLNEQWEVYWYEHNKMHAKPFPIKKFGIDESKFEAVKFLNLLKSTGRYAEELGEMKTNVPGVFWDERLQMWFNSRRSFTASRHGVREARSRAEIEEEKISENTRLARQSIDKAIKQFQRNRMATSSNDTDNRLV